MYKGTVVVPRRVHPALHYSVLRCSSKILVLLTQGEKVPPKYPRARKRQGKSSRTFKVVLFLPCPAECRPTKQVRRRIPVFSRCPPWKKFTKTEARSNYDAKRHLQKNRIGFSLICHGTHPRRFSISVILLLVVQSNISACLVCFRTLAGCQLLTSEIVKLTLPKHQLQAQIYEYEVAI